MRGLCRGRADEDHEDEPMAGADIHRHHDRRRARGDDRAVTLMGASVAAMQWRLEEAAHRIREAADALGRGDRERAHLRLLDLEPLVHEAERVLAAALILVGEESR